MDFRDFSGPARDAMWLVLDTAMLGLGCRDPENDRARCEAIREAANMYGFQAIVERANQWLAT